MTNAILHGKLYTGNPHVSFDSGEVASAATPRRGSLLYKRTCRICFCAALAIGLAHSSAAVDWQFTGATNRTAAVSVTRAISGEFDSQIPSTVLLEGLNMRSDVMGLVIIVH